MRVCVIGAGIIGAAVSYHLAARGAKVTVLDAAVEPRGASWATFGWINANGKKPAEYMELNQRGMAAHGELATMLGDDSWLRFGGSIEWAVSEADSDALAARVDQSNEVGYPAQLLDAAALRDLEPELRPQQAPVLIAHFPSEGWADSTALVSVLLGAARESGAVVRLGARVGQLEPKADGTVSALLAGDGRPIFADAVVNCAGADAGDLGTRHGFSLDTAGPRGINAISTPLQSAGPRRVVRSPGVHFRPDTGGRLMISSPAIDAKLEAGADTVLLAARLLRMAAECLPGLYGATIEEARVARRAIPPDGLPVVGRTDDTPWLYHVVTHSGVTLAPLLGRLVSAEIMDGREDPSLAPYRPKRFLVG